MKLTGIDSIAEAAEKFYDERHRAAFEQTHMGQFVVIDARTGEAYSGKYPEDAMKAARDSAPYGVFHTIRVGFPAAYRMSGSGPGSTTRNWAL